ncbi:MAG: ATP-binding cassette domain-containing protein, partial [Trichococcus sp.]
MAFVELKNLNKFYPISGAEDFQALKDVNLSLDKGELVSIVGESGSGKSTLMNLLGGLDSQFSGEITIDG